MAIKLDAGEVTRSEVHNILPEHIIVNHAENSRTTRRTPEQVAAFARRILDEGQLTPCLFRRVEGNRVKLVDGYGRHEAISYINTSLNPPQPIRVQGKFVDANPEEAFVKGIKTNLDRLDPNAMDAAHAQRVLRETYHWADDRIADLYEKSVSWVAQNRKLLQLSVPLQEMVRMEELPVSTALLVTELPEAEREPAVMEAVNATTGKVNGETIKKKVRARRQASSSTQKTGLSLKEFKEFLLTAVGPADWNDQPSIKELCNTMLDFLAGKKTEKQMNNSLAKNCTESK